MTQEALQLQENGQLIDQHFRQEASKLEHRETERLQSALLGGQSSTAEDAL